MQWYKTATCTGVRVHMTRLQAPLYAYARTLSQEVQACFTFSYPVNLDVVAPVFGSSLALGPASQQVVPCALTVDGWLGWQKEKARLFLLSRRRSADADVGNRRCGCCGLPSQPLPFRRALWLGLIGQRTDSSCCTLLCELHGLASCLQARIFR